MPKLTDRFLTSFTLELGRKDQIVFDTECPGLGVRITAKGTRTFLVQWTDPATKQKVRERLGVWGSLTIDQARTAARARHGDVARGIDPAAERKRKKADADARKAELALSLDGLIAEWASRHLAQRRPRYAAEAERALRYAFADHLKAPAARLTRASVITILDAISHAGKTTTAGRTMAYGRACFSWAEKREKVAANPFRGLPVSSGVTERDRVLDDAEVACVWAAASGMPYPFGPFYQTALLTLQRREEVAGMRWSELSLEKSMWTIPAERMKNHRPHDVHLTLAAKAVLESIPRIAGQEHVFTTRGDKPISGYSKGKRSLDAAIADAREGRALAAWRLHDFRRTGVSKLAAMGFDSIIVDKLLAHKPAALKGVASVYQRHGFYEERARALDAWGAHVAGVVSGNVVRLRTGSLGLRERNLD
jgi:integrase